MLSLRKTSVIPVVKVCFVLPSDKYRYNQHSNAFLI